MDPKFLEKITNQSALDQDNDDIRFDELTQLELEEMENYEEDEELNPFNVPGHAKEGGYYMSNHVRPSRPNTGPKGVKEDYEEAKQRMRIMHQYQKEKYLRSAEKNSFTVLTSNEEDELNKKEKQILEEYSDDDEDEESFLERYKRKKLMEWQKSRSLIII
eukprot:TRINITY_DN11668_c0_g1_i2.p1 TRINITY_DN11668_c0_g1~~TRINITY_DN11668_c0_g1_i2.p1  ORF type:complete len:161 (+),score=69.13 TRINITY_DN11668_c0_g1_i2:53-535(+)